jgi:hypothetical protein
LTLWIKAVLEVSGRDLFGSTSVYFRGSLSKIG